MRSRLGDSSILKTEDRRGQRNSRPKTCWQQLHRQLTESWVLPAHRLFQGFLKTDADWPLKMLRLEDPKTLSGFPWLAAHSPRHEDSVP